MAEQPILAMSPKPVFGPQRKQTIQHSSQLRELLVSIFHTTALGSCHEQHTNTRFIANTQCAIEYVQLHEETRSNSVLPPNSLCRKRVLGTALLRMDLAPRAVRFNSRHLRIHEPVFMFTVHNSCSDLNTV